MHRQALHKSLSLGIVLLLSLAAIACGGSKMEGTYSNASGMVTLDLRSGGEASFTMMGETEACTYKVEGKKLHLKCKENEADFEIHNDGSLSGPGFIGMLKKSKS
ncbi:MAG: hypothetical protein ACE145_10610 [Terriglobia bacterium]